MSVLTEFFMQEITVANLLHTTYCSLIFAHLKLGNLEKRPNIQRYVI
jgi:hypothetical protein